MVGKKRDIWIIKLLFQNGLKNLIFCGLYYEHITIINYDSSIINKFGTSLTGDARVIIYDRHMFIVQATGLQWIYSRIFLSTVGAQ